MSLRPDGWKVDTNTTSMEHRRLGIEMRKECKEIMNPSVNINIEIRAGVSIDQACAIALAIASKLECNVSFIFNEQESVVNPYQTLSQILRAACRQLGL